jgi:hypothetical protein
MFQLNTPGYVPCDVNKKGWMVLDEHWKSVATACGLRASTPVEAHPNCARICMHRKNLLGVGCSLKKGVLSRKPDKAILELECVVCQRPHKKLSFATTKTTASPKVFKELRRTTHTHVCTSTDRPFLFLFSGTYSRNNTNSKQLPRTQVAMLHTSRQNVAHFQVMGQVQLRTPICVLIPTLYARSYRSLDRRAGK